MHPGTGSYSLKSFCSRARDARFIVAAPWSFVGDGVVPGEGVDCSEIIFFRRFMRKNSRWAF